MIPWRHANSGLALACVLLGLLLQWAPWKNSVTAVPITRLAPGTVNAIRVFRGNELVLDVLRDARGWVATHPDVGRAKTERVETLLSLLSATSARQMQPSEADLVAFGLSPVPRLRVQFDDTVIGLGRTAMPAHQVYVLSTGRVHLVSEHYAHLAGLPATHFLEPD